jgi:hypothetical protein
MAPVVVGPGASGQLADTCALVAQLDERLAGLMSVELRLPNRVALDIELGKVEAAYSELSQAEMGDLEDTLEKPLERLGYRMVDLEIAVEDFRTNRRPKRAAPHVEEDAGAFGRALAELAILAGC